MSTAESWLNLDQYIARFRELGVRAVHRETLKWLDNNVQLRPSIYLNRNREVGVYFTIRRPYPELDPDLFQQVPREMVKEKDRDKLNVRALGGREPAAIRQLVRQI